MAPISGSSSAVTRPGRRRHLWLIIGGVAAALAVITGLWWLSSRPAAIEYKTADVTRGTVSRAIIATGTVNPVLTIIVGTYVSGVIQQLFCDYNTVVKEGQICAKIDPRPYQAIVDEDKANLVVAQAQLQKDKANLAYAQLNYQRNAKLAAQQYVSQDVADNAKSVYNQAQAQVSLDEATIQQREAQLNAAQVNLGYTDIVSPVNGVVVSRNVTIGQTVAASFQTPTLFLIATDLTKMQVDTNVSESDIGAIKTGDAATFTVDAFPNRTFNGTVSQVRQSPQTVQNVVTYDVVIGVDNSDLSLKPGMTASVQIVTEQRKDVVRVPDQALRFASAEKGPLSLSGPSTQPRVIVLREGRPVAVPVAVGLDDGTYTELVKGDLKPGDRVIVGERQSAGRRSGPLMLRF